MFSSVSTSSVLALLPSMVHDLPFFGLVDIRPYVVAAVIFIGLTLLFKLLQMVIIARLRTLSKKTSTDIDDVLIDAVSDIRAWAYTIVAFYVALMFLALPGWLDTALTTLFLFTIAWQGIEFAVKLIDYGAKRMLAKDEDGDGVVDPNAATATDMVTLIARIVLWAFGGIFVLSNLGIEVTSLIAGLGIGGIAIAFALQGILSDLFASFSIYFDKPFRVGDFINVGSDYGTVENIGIKSTRLRTLQGEELVISNAELTTARINNFKRMDERRIVSNFGVVYETPTEKVKQIPDIIAEAFNAVEGGRLDRVHFTTFGDFSLNYELVYYIETSDYVEYLDIQQQFNYELMERFAQHGIEFAYPTQVIYAKGASIQTQ